MRIVVLGDFHLNVNELNLTEKAMEDISSCSPDLVVPLGDFGCNASIGGPEGLEQAYRFLGQLSAPLRPILGNHDMQRETGKGRGTQPRGTMEKAFLDLFQLDHVNGVLEFDSFRLFFAGTDLQPPDSCYMEQECYVTEEHFAQLRLKLQERPGVPCLFFTHAPPAGAGLRTVPRVHVRATNAYLDQNHDYDRWIELVREHPQIILWFSAHYHLGHEHSDSITTRHGTTFCITGVHGSCTRDGTRQSRVIDIEDGMVRVRTLDHVGRNLRETVDWMGELRTAPVEVSDIEEEKPVSCSRQPRLVSSCSIGDEPAIPAGLVPMQGEQILVATQDGFLWEVRPAFEAVMGSLHLGPALSSALLAEDGVWRAWDHTLVRCDPASPWRFQRYKPEETYPDMVQLQRPVGSIAPRTGGGLWAACGNELLAVDLNEVRSITVLGQGIRKLFNDLSSGLYALMEDGSLYKLLMEGDALVGQVLHGEGLIAWDIWNGESAGIASGEEAHIVHVSHVTQSGNEVCASLPLAASASVDPASLASPGTWTTTTQVCLLGEGFVLIQLGDNVYLWNTREPGSPVRLPIEDFCVHAISRGQAGAVGSARFAVCATPSRPHSRPQLQLWEF